MNSVTPGERREVAKSLRYLAEMTGEPLENDGQFVEVLKYWVFSDFKRYSYDETLNRLADLIDPTCKPYITCESLTESITKYTAECSNCGAIFGDFPTIEQAKTTHPVYCPACGARVVRDEA